MTGRFLLAVLLTLSLVGQILGQSPSGSASVAASPVSPSGSVSVVAPSTSASAGVPSTSASAGVPSTSASSVVAPSTSASAVVVAPSTSGSALPVPSTSTSAIPPPPPAAPVNLTNEFPGCALRPDHTNHITYLCLAWSDPTGQSVSWIVTITPNSAVPGPYTTNIPQIFIGNLTAGTAYTITIVGVNAAGVQSAPLTKSGAQFTTSPTDAKTAYLTKDLQNLACAPAKSNVTFRNIINCNWGLPPTPNTQPFRIDVKARCVSVIAKNKVIRRSLKGTATSVLLPVNRAQYTCNIEIFGVYLNHVANDGHGHKFVQTCTSGTGCVKVQ